MFIRFKEGHRLQEGIIFLNKPFLQLIIIQGLFIAFFFFFGDHGWFEDDTISHLDGILNFDAKGPEFVYRYYWQPLTYELNRAIYALFHHPKWLYAIPHLVSACNMTLLAVAIFLFSRRKLSLFFSVALLSFFPELFFCGLYYNATVFGMLPMIVALLLLFWKSSDVNITLFSWNILRWILIGVCTILAVFFRVDFLLCVPLVAYLLFTENVPNYKALMWYAIGGGLTVIFCVVVGLVDLSALRNILHDHYYGTIKSLTQPWTLTMSFTVFFTITNLGIWFVLLLYFILFIYKCVKEKKWLALGILFPILILLYPVPQLTSPKYCIPGILFLPFILVKILAVCQEKLTHATYQHVRSAVLCVSILCQIISIQPTIAFPLQKYSVQPVSAFPYLIMQPVPTFIYTHDGLRPLGAYLRGYNMVRKAPLYQDGLFWVGHRISDAVIASNQNVSILFLKKAGNSLVKGYYWGFLSNTIAFLQLEGYSLQTLISSKHIILTRAKQTVDIHLLDETEYAYYQTPPQTILIKTPYVNENVSEDFTELQKFLQTLPQMKSL